MSYLNFSPPLNAQNLRNKDLIDLIKNNEYYSGCYSIIQEKNLRGLDILNLSENTLASWKLPQWLSKKLLSLKETLLKNPGSLKPQEEENPSDDTRKNISNTLTTLFKNKQKPILPYKKHAEEKKDPDLNLIYDDDNYLKPQFNNSMRRPKNETKLPLLKLPEKSKSFSGRSHEISSIPTRKPVALPRPDLDEEENEYEPPPSHNSRSKKPASKLPLPPPPADETDEYEPPPRFGTKQPETTQEEDYEYIETKKEEGAKSPVSKFYVDSDFPPPLPERSVLQKIETKKWSFLPMYMNVDKAQSPTSNASNLPVNRTRKITPKATKPISPVSDAKNSDAKATWSVLTRPLPPLPVAPTSQTEYEIENDEATYEDTAENLQTEGLAEYGNIPESTNAPSISSRISESKSKTSRDHIDDLRSHLSNFKLRTPHPPRSKQPTFDDEDKELKDILEKRQKTGKETSETVRVKKKELTLLKSQMRLPLPPMSLPQSVQNTYFDDVIRGNQLSSNDFGDDSNGAQEDEGSEGDLPEYLNTTETKTKAPAWKSQPPKQSPISQLALEISQKKLKPTSPKRDHSSSNWSVKEKLPIAEDASNSTLRGTDESSFEDDEQEDDLPEYLNTTETKTKPPAWKSEPSKSSPISQLALEISQKKLKATSPKRNISDSNWTVQEKTTIIHDSSLHETESDFEDEQDRLPEYLNTTEPQIPEPKIKKNEHHAPRAANDSSSQITKLKVKAKDIHLNDKLADELRILLEKRKGSNENVDTERGPVDSYPRKNLPKKPTENSVNSTANIAEIEDDDVDEFEQENYDVAGSYNDMLNFNNEPFYRNTDRKGAIALLRDLENGAFLLRPSSKFFLSITIKNNGKYFNLGIEKTPQNKIFCGEGMMRTQEFFSLRKFLEHFEHNPLILQGERGLEEVYLKKVLPLDRF